MDDKIPFCSFCGKTASQVRQLIAAPKEDTFICDECVEWCVDLLDAEFEKEGILEKDGNSINTLLEKIEILKPTIIKSYLDQYIIGQDRVKERVAVAVYNHYKRISTPIVNDVEIEKSNICIVGPTGTGKCICGNSKVKIRNKKTGKIYYDTINNLKNMLITNSTKN